MIVMNTCYILIGSAASGKTTWASNHKRPDDAQVSLDIYRIAFYKSMHPAEDDVKYDSAWTYCCSHGKEFDDYVKAEAKLAFTLAAKNNNNVYVDNTNLTAKSRKRWVDLAKKHNFKIIAVEFRNTLQRVLERNANRQDKFIPENVVKDQFYRQECVQLGVEVDDIITIR